MHKIGGVDQTVTNRMVPGVWWPIYEEGASVWWLMVRVFFYCCAAMLYVETLARIAHEWLSACVPMVLSTRAFGEMCVALVEMSATSMS